MTHVRQQVRNKITEVVNGILSFDNNVFENRTYELRKEELPAAIIFSGPEIIERATEKHRQPGLQKRKIETSIYVFARSPQNIGDLVDALAVEVEEAIFADPTLGGLAAETIVLDCVTHIDAESDVPVGALRIALQSTVFTREGNPSQAIQQ